MNTKMGLLGVGIVAKVVLLGMGIAGVAGLAGCSATMPPQQLADARLESQKAANVPQSGLVQSDLYDAKQALNAAEESFKSDGDTEQTRSLAYVADRKFIAASAKAQAMDSLNQKKVAEANFNQWKEQQALATRDQLGKAQNALSQAQRDADAARAKLSEIEGLKTKQTDKGVVLSLSGSVLFETGKSTLLPQATQKLKEVAKAMTQDTQHPTFDVIGYTDSTGTKAINDKLSKERADAVRSYLVSQGVAGDKIRSEGMGPSNPVASNASPEGRAENRRVEIVLENGK